MYDLEKKIFSIYVNLCNTYRNEEEKEETVKEEFCDNFADDLTAALIALYTLYGNVVGDNPDDLIGFTHVLNRLAIQYCIQRETK